MREDILVPHVLLFPKISVFNLEFLTRGSSLDSLYVRIFICLSVEMLFIESLSFIPYNPTQIPFFNLCIFLPTTTYASPNYNFNQSGMLYLLTVS